MRIHFIVLILLFMSFILYFGSCTKVINDVHMHEAAQVECDNIQDILLDNLFAGKEPELPKLLLLLGPPGSGKSRIVSQVLDMQMHHMRYYVEIVIDHMLRQVPSYKEQMIQLQLQRKDMSLDEFLKKSQAIYSVYRPAIKRFSKLALEKAFDEKLNIIFETTGSNLTAVLEIIQHAKAQQYQVQMVFPYVTNDKLHERVYKRNSNIGRAIPISMVLDMVKKSHYNFLELLSYADNAHIYDNNPQFNHDQPLRTLFSMTEFKPLWIDPEDEKIDQISPCTEGEIETPRFFCNYDLLELYPELTHLLALYCSESNDNDDDEVIE